MSQHLFANDTSFSLSTLDANFNDLYGQYVYTYRWNFGGNARSLTLAGIPAGEGGPSYLMMGNSDSGGAAGPAVFVSANRSISIGFGTSFSSSSGGTVTAVVAIEPGIFRPASDASASCGGASYRWSTVYASTGTINTSDAREKTAVAPLTPAELAASKALAAELGSFRFLSAVAAKGAVDARMHIGMTVQRAMDVMTAHGLNPLAYGFICHDTWQATGSTPATADAPEVPGAPPGDRYGFRTDELLLFIARGFDARLQALEANA